MAKTPIMLMNLNIYASNFDEFCSKVSIPQFNLANRLNDTY